MISGVVDEKGVPFVLLEIAGVHRRAIIDTGFNGDLELPEELREHVNARWAFEATAELAAGITVQEDVYAVDFPFDGAALELEATFADSTDVLIGTRLLRGYRLSINFVARTVRIQRLGR